ncbi:hypothetical protein U9M48_004732 [Paspalum notatum var. saurae]|uniref:Uncharacterized protein n=1 Tax=Paspalum notatum var. saurae TaxID=547442 RepID=A0AAQ3SF14_PASNO
MGRSPCCEQAHTNKGAWTKEEDQRLVAYIKAHGEGCWRSLPKAAGLLRCGKSCRLRWINYLRPDLKRGNFTDDEDELIVKFHELFGNKWSLIAGRLPGRTDNEIKNYWNTHIKRKLLARGIDPQTHRPLAAAGIAPAQRQQQQHRPPPQQQHYLPDAVPKRAASGSPEEEEACSRSSDDEPPPPARSATPPEPASRRRQRHLDIDLNLSISLAAYGSPAHEQALKEEEASAAEFTAIGDGSNAAAAVCLCLNNLGYRPGVDCVCGGGGASSSSRQQEQQWAARSFLQAAAAPCYRGQ